MSTCLIFAGDGTGGSASCSACLPSSSAAVECRHRIFALMCKGLLAGSQSPSKAKKVCDCRWPAPISRHASWPSHLSNDLPAIDVDRMRTIIHRQYCRSMMLLVRQWHIPAPSSRHQRALPNRSCSCKRQPGIALQWLLSLSLSLSLSLPPSLPNLTEYVHTSCASHDWCRKKNEIDHLIYQVHGRGADSDDARFHRHAVAALTKQQ